MPVRGASSRPVRLRPPSMKYSSGWPRAIMKPRYLVNTAAYSASPLKLRRRKNAPPLRRNRPTTGRLRLMPGGHVRHGEALAVDHVGEQQIIHMAAVTGHVDDLGAVADLVQLLHVLELHAVVQASP